MEGVEDVLSFGLRKLGYSELRESQRKVVESYVSGKDIFFCSPMGSGKSLCFEIAPFVFEGIAVGVENAERQAYIIICMHSGGPSGVFDEKPSMV